jgi:hypothetical protein
MGIRKKKRTGSKIYTLLKWLKILLFVKLQLNLDYVKMFWKKCSYCDLYMAHMGSCKCSGCPLFIRTWGGRTICDSDGEHITHSVDALLSANVGQWHDAKRECYIITGEIWADIKKDYQIAFIKKPKNKTDKCGKITL